MNIEKQIKNLTNAVDNGLDVFWRYDNYELVKINSEYFVYCKETKKYRTFISTNHKTLNDDFDIRDFYIFNPISAQEAKEIFETNENVDQSKMLSYVFDMIRKEAKRSKSIDIDKAFVSEQIVKTLINQYNFSVVSCKNKTYYTISWK